MAMNPMKRKARNSFLVGFLIALIIMALVVMFVLYKMQEIKNDYDELLSTQKSVYIASGYLTSGTEVTIASFSTELTQTSLSTNDLIKPSDFETENEDGSITEKKVLVRTDIPAGTIITKDLLVEVDDETTNDQRLQEYNMILLPTHLDPEQYIDIRLMLPSGEDYIVVSKKKVEETDATTVWLKMYEEEILMLDNAIVEAYTIPGSKLYANTYTQAGMQQEAQTTYTPSEEVWNVINNDPNIVNDARDALWARYNGQQQVNVRNRINNILSTYRDAQDASVESGLQEEIAERQEKRQEYVDALGGTVE